MSERKNNTPRIILYTLLVIMLVAVVYFLFFFKWPGDSPVDVFVNNIKTVNKAVQDNLPSGEEVRTEEIQPNNNTPAPTNEDIDRNTAAKIASAFAERFGSYSNQSDYGNITDLRSLMTDKMKAWADDYVAEARESNIYGGTYEGITATAISAKVKNFDSAAGLAEIIVSTQRSKVSGDSAANVYYEDVAVKMVKEGNDWKIDSAYWQGKK